MKKACEAVTKLESFIRDEDFKESGHRAKALKFCSCIEKDVDRIWRYESGISEEEQKQIDEQLEKLKEILKILVNKLRLANTPDGVDITKTRTELLESIAEAQATISNLEGKLKTWEPRIDYRKIEMELMFD